MALQFDYNDQKDIGAILEKAKTPRTSIFITTKVLLYEGSTPPVV